MNARLRYWAAGACAVVGVLAIASSAYAASNKLALTGQFGFKVNATNNGTLCTVESGDACQSGVPSEASGGFDSPTAAAPGPLVKGEGFVYVSDVKNSRIQKFTSAGVFVSMFGWNVNKTKVGLGSATQVEKNICTALSGDTCGRGEPGGGAGQIAVSESVAVDPATEDIYVLDYSNSRVEQYTAEGLFLRMIGGEVNETATQNHEIANENVCPVKPGDVCKAGVPTSMGSTIHGAFKPQISEGDLLAVGGPEDRLYVGDEGRVQEFNSATGEWVEEISGSPLLAAAQIEALAVDPIGNVYLAYDSKKAVYKFPFGGATPTEFRTGASVVTLALDPFDRIAVTSFESKKGYLYSSTGVLLGEFGPPGGLGFVFGVSFNDEGELYVADASNQDVEIYAQTPVADLATNDCKSPTSTSVTLAGEVNPKGLTGEETRARFEYGTSEELGSVTPFQNMGTGSVFVPIEAELEGLRPNQIYYYRVAAEDEKARAPEPPLIAETIRPCATLALPPAIEGRPEAFDVTFSSAVLEASVNPENAQTTYRFEYGPCEHLGECSAVEEGPQLESSGYGDVDVRQTISDLKPGTLYSYRLVAVNGHGERTVGLEGSHPLETMPAPHPTAVTELPSDVTATSAILMGAVDPDGRSATFSFLAGVVNGNSTVLGSAVSGATGSDVGLQSESYRLQGLQPATTYAYAVKIAGAYGTQTGELAFFTTSGIPVVLNPPVPGQLLPVPRISFPKPSRAVSKCKHGYKRVKRGKCVKTKKVKSRSKGAHDKKSVGHGAEHMSGRDNRIAIEMGRK